MSSIASETNYTIRHRYFHPDLIDEHFDKTFVLTGYENVVNYCREHTDWHDYVTEMFAEDDYSNKPFSFKSDLEAIEFSPLHVIQFLTNLYSSDTEYDDNLNYCLITLNQKVLTELLELSKWQKVFPQTHEITLLDQEGIAEFLSGDEEETLFLEMDEPIRVIYSSEGLIERSEDDNDSDAWEFQLRKIIIRQNDIRFVGVYEWSLELRNAFTVSEVIPLSYFENALKFLKGEVTICQK